MIISKTPLRISFLGGNTDFPYFYKQYGGCVLATTVDKYIYCIVRKRQVEKIFVNWLEHEIVKSVDDIRHDLVREAMRKVGVGPGVEITFLSDIHSEGSGLGSSASVLVGVLNALYHFKGFNPNAEQLAREAIEIELDVLKRPVGIQDPYAVAYGGLRFFEFGTNASVTSKLVSLNKESLNDFTEHLLVFFTGQVRKSFSVLTDVVRGLRDNQDKVLELKKAAQLGYMAIEKDNFFEVGKLLHRGWLVKKQLSSYITNEAIDMMYQKALDNGAVGGKILGAGGGGFLLVIVPRDKKNRVREALADFSEMPVKIDQFGSRIVFNSED